MDTMKEIYDLSWNEVVSKRFNNPLLPKSIRGVIVSKSGCGKTTLLMNLLLRPQCLDYDNLYIFGKSLFQPEYRVIKKAFEEKLPKEVILKLFFTRDEIQDLNVSPSALIEEWVKTLKKKSDIKCTFFENGEDVPDPRELKTENKNLMIFDDLLLDKQNKCECYYVRERHSNVDCFYLSQNYFRLPRQTIRENANVICLFQQDLKNINHIYEDHVGDDMTKEEFRKFCKTCWESPHGFVVIDLTSEKGNGKYRKGFDSIYIPRSVLNFFLYIFFFFKLKNNFYGNILNCKMDNLPDVTGFLYGANGYDMNAFIERIKFVVENVLPRNLENCTVRMFKKRIASIKLKKEFGSFIIGKEGISEKELYVSFIRKYVSELLTDLNKYAEIFKTEKEDRTNKTHRNHVKKIALCASKIEMISYIFDEERINRGRFTLCVDGIAGKKIKVTKR